VSKQFKYVLLRLNVCLIHKKSYEYFETGFGKWSKDTAEIYTSILIAGQKPQILENVSVCVVIELVETGLCSGITVGYVIMCVEETRDKNLDGWLTVHLSITLVWSPNWCTKFLFIHI